MNCDIVCPQVPDHFSRQEAWLEAELVRARSLGVRHIMVFQVTRQSRVRGGVTEHCIAPAHSLVRVPPR